MGANLTRQGWEGVSPGDLLRCRHLAQPVPEETGSDRRRVEPGREAVGSDLRG
jgi:hypothetical protein